MEFQILGPLEVRGDAAPVALGAAKQRTLLAILLVHANEVIPTDRLIEELWPEPPRTAANALQVNIGKLRKALDPGRTPGSAGELLITRTPGYILRVEPDELDADRFERLIAEGRSARQANDPETVACTLRRALDLWRGPALVDFAYDPFAQAEIARLEELRLDAVEERIEADLDLGGGGELVGELESLISDNPLRERLRGQLMLALYRSGRQAHALEVYRQTSQTLRDELGLAPSRGLQRLQTAILRQEQTLDVSIEPSARTQPSKPEAEEAAPAEPDVRKTVTVLVARRPSVRGMDPEALSSEDRRFGARLGRIIGRYGGVIASTLGDDVMAVFGAPRAHEDDAFRAACAAVEIRDTSSRDEVTPTATPRAGIATGEILASGSGADPRAIVGEPVSAAGELQSAAGPGEILVGEETERLIREQASVELVATAAGPAWRLHDVRRGRPAVGSLKSALVGREAELGRLRDASEQVIRAGTPGLFTILGVAGIGKSRLAQEFAASAAEHATVVVGRCVPYGEGITFWALREIVSQLMAGDSAIGQEARSIAAGLQEAIGGGSVEREEIFWETRRLFATLARDRPLVVFFEDVHWAEPTFLDLVEYLAVRTPDAPILLVCIARPELLEQRPDWTRERRNAGSQELERLPEPECEMLIANLAQDLAKETQARLLDTAEGNPLFIEQLVAMLTERHGYEAGLSIPPTIDALLQARLDRLGPGERAVISRAAIVGKEFSAEATVDLLPEEARQFGPRHLETLAAKEFIGPARVPRDGGSFRFRHILIQEAAYRATPKSLRSALHERFADWVEDTSRDGADEHAEIAGYHLEQAFRYRAELGVVGEQELALAHRAGDRLAAAGQRAFRRGDMPATVNLLGRAATLPTPRGGPGLAGLPELGYALFEIGEVNEASAVLAGARERARADGDRLVEWRVTITRPRIEMYRDPRGIDLDALTVETETAIDVLRELGDETGLARAYMVLSDLHWSKGRLRETIDTATLAADYARRAGNRREVGWALGQNALCAIHGPMPVNEGLAWLERLLRGEPENRTLDANLSGFVTVLEAMSGRFDEARRHIEESRALARDLGLIWQASVQELLSGYIELMAGNPVAAEREMRAAAEGFREIGEGWFLSVTAVDLLRAIYEQGRYEDAFALLETVDEIPGPDCEWLVKRRGVPACLLARHGQIEEGERLAREGVAVAADSEFVVLHADVLLDLAEVLDIAGRPEEAREATAQAVSIYERKGALAAARKARGLLTAASG
jgi:DNA-binding SARP family transcriptional activator/tetratricopeptide (TPR) repeat protein